MQDNPAEFNLVDMAALKPNVAEVQGLQSGWTQISTRDEITDLSMFADARVIWVYINETYHGWSSNQRLDNKLSIHQITN